MGLRHPLANLPRFVLRTDQQRIRNTCERLAHIKPQCIRRIRLCPLARTGFAPVQRRPVGIMPRLRVQSRRTDLPPRAAAGIEQALLP